MVHIPGFENFLPRSKKLLEAVPGIVILFSAEGKLIWANQRFLKHLPQGMADNLHKGLIPIISTNQRGLFARNCAHALAKPGEEITFNATFEYCQHQSFRFTISSYQEKGSSYLQLFAFALDTPATVEKPISSQNDYFHHLPSYVLVVNYLGEIKGASNYLLRHLQLESKDLIGKSIDEVLAREYPIERLYKKLKILFRRGSLYNYPLTLQTIQGHRVEAMINARVEPFQWSNEPLAVLMLQDLTHLNLVQRELKLKEKAIEANSNPVVLISPQNRITYVNPAFLKVWGIQMPEEVLDTHFLFMFPESEHPVLFSLMKELRRYGECRGTLKIFRTDNGKEALLEMTTAQILQPNGNFIGYIATFFDITRSKRDEQQIRYQADLIEQVNDAIISVDSNFHIVTWNQGARKMLRDPKESIKGKSLFSLVDFGNRKRFIEKELPRKEEWQGELELKVAPEKQVETLAAFKKNKVHASGEKEEYVFVFTDVSSLKHHQRELNILNEQLIKKNKSLSEFTYIVSHNLRAPIANLVGLCKLYNKHNPHDPLNNELINQIENSANQLDESVIDLNRILEFSRKQDHPNELTPLNEAFEEAFIPLKETYEALGAKVNIDFSDAPEVWSIRQYVRNIFLELLNNAFKFRVTELPLNVNITSRSLPHSVEVSFTDNGLGIDLDRHGKKIFNLYRRFHHQIPGKGVGLYLIRTQMEAHGGEIRVESAPYQGTTFRLTFPTLVR